MAPDLWSTLRDPARLASLQASGLLDTPLEEVFDRLTRLTVNLLKSDYAAVSVVAADRHFFKSRVHLGEEKATQEVIPLSRSFCKHVVACGEPLVIDDARLHSLWKGHVLMAEGIRSYAGIPLVTREGHALGTVCAYGHAPRRWTPEEVGVLEEFARSAVTEIELRMLLRTLHGEVAETVNAERLRALRELSLGLRHEINNALTGLLIRAELLQQSPHLGEEERVSAQVVGDQAQRIAAVLRRLDDVGSLPLRASALGGEMIDLST